MSSSEDVETADDRVRKKQFYFPLKIPMPFPVQL